MWHLWMSSLFLWPANNSKNNKLQLTMKHQWKRNISWHYTKKTHLKSTNAYKETLQKWFATLVTLGLDWVNYFYLKNSQFNTGSEFLWIKYWFFKPEFNLQQKSNLSVWGESSFYILLLRFFREDLKGVKKGLNDRRKRIRLFFRSRD